jgi:hypothetical protein
VLWYTAEGRVFSKERNDNGSVVWLVDLADCVTERFCHEASSVSQTIHINLKVGLQGEDRVASSVTRPLPSINDGISRGDPLRGRS